jgi:hypothetical protein
MTRILMKSEFDYFTVSRDEIIDNIVSDGYADDVTERVQRTITWLAERCTDHIAADGSAHPLAADWGRAISGYLAGHKARDGWSPLRDGGSLQFDSFAEEDYGQFWIVDLHVKNQQRGEAFQRQFLVILREGMAVDNISHAFTVDDLETAYEVVRPSTAELWCQNPDCHGYLECRDGYSLRTEQDRRYEPERGEYDADGILCPFCTVYLTKEGEASISATQGDAFGVAASGQLQEPWHLVATLNVCD